MFVEQAGNHSQITRTCGLTQRLNRCLATTIDGDADMLLQVGPVVEAVFSRDHKLCVTQRDFSAGYASGRCGFEPGMVLQKPRDGFFATRLAGVGRLFRQVSQNLHGP